MPYKVVNIKESRLEEELNSLEKQKWELKDLVSKFRDSTTYEDYWKVLLYKAGK